MQQSKGFEDIVAQIEYELDITGVDRDLTEFVKSWEQSKNNIKKLGSVIENMGALGTTCGPSLGISILVGDALVEALRLSERKRKKDVSPWA